MAENNCSAIYKSTLKLYNTEVVMSTEPVVRESGNTKNGKKFLHRAERIKTPKGLTQIKNNFKHYFENSCVACRGTK